MKNNKILLSLLIIGSTLISCMSLSSLAQPTAIPTSTLTLTPAPTNTPTPVPPTVLVTAPANCYSGPGINYEKIATMKTGTTVDVIGRETTGNYWIVKDPNDDSSGCWLQAQYVALEGDTTNLKIFPPPPTPLPPDSPKYFRAYNTCTYVWMPVKERGFTITIFLAWDDEPAATGYRIYKDGVLLATLDANINQYQDQISMRVKSNNQTIVYEIEAFNNSGSSEREQLTFAYSCNWG